MCGFYGFFTAVQSFAIEPLRTLLREFLQALFEREMEHRHMSILDGLSLALATGLFIYLTVALLRAGRG